MRSHSRWIDKSVTDKNRFTLPAAGQATVFSSAFHLCNPRPGFLNARSRIHPSIRFLFSRSALWHQQWVRFHHLAIRSDAGRIFGGPRSVDRGHRCVGKSLAISLGTGGGSDLDRAPLVSVGTWHIRGDVVACCASAASSKRRRHFDGCCFCFASCGNIDRPSGWRVDGAYGRRKGKRSRRWLVSGGKSRRQWHRRWPRRLACESHFSKEIAGGGLAIAMLVSAGAIYFASDVRVVANETLGERMRILWRDILSMVRAAIPLFTIVLVCSPIGAGAMNNLWSAVAPDWSATPDQVALVSGVLNGVVSTIGCVIGGWLADRLGRWWSYFGSGILMAMVAIIMAVTAHTPNAFSVGVLAYALTCGRAYAAFSAIVLLAIGRGAASTKYATLSSLGNLPVVYMTTSDGWVHDRFGTAWMLHSEALIAIICIVLALAVLRWINPPRRSDLVLP